MLTGEKGEVLRILSFSCCFPNRAVPNWGIFVYQRLAAMAQCADLKVVSPVPTFPVVTHWRNGAACGQEEWQGLSVHRPRFFYVPGILKSLDARFYATGLRRWLKKQIEKWQPDLLDAHFVWPDGVGVSLLAKKLGLPYSITLRGKIYPCLEVPSQRRQCAEALQGATVVISVDQRMATLARDLGVDASQVHVISNGVNLDRFRPSDRMAARRELGLPTKCRLLVSVAHLGERKGHRETIQALTQLPDEVRLVLVGGDSSAHRGGKHQLEELASSLRVRERVSFAGKQPFERIPLYYCAADVSVLVSWREGCPNVVLESLACGTPVVASDVGSVPDMIVDGCNGQIVPPREVEPLVMAIQKSLDLKPLPADVRSSAVVRSWDSVARQVCDILAASIGSGRSRNRGTTYPSA
jgi:glycosyltransferase involved in cell wall biosynthesis